MGEMIWVVGGDGRQRALARGLKGAGYPVTTFALGAGDAESLAGLEEARCVVLPLPALGRDGFVNTPLWDGRLMAAEVVEAMAPGNLLCAGMATAGLAALAAERGVVLRDYLAREELAVKNAVPTAEGAIRIALDRLPITLCGAGAAVVGYGRIGKALLPRLRGLGAEVTVFARSPVQRAEVMAMGGRGMPLDRLGQHIGEMDVIFNTVPAPVLDRAVLERVKPGALVIDLASAPGGTDFAAGEALGVGCVHALALPGKEAPESAGGYIMESVIQIMEEME